MDYCSSCRRHLNGALVCPGCGAYARDIAPPSADGRDGPAGGAASAMTGDGPGATYAGESAACDRWHDDPLRDEAGTIAGRAGSPSRKSRCLSTPVRRRHRSPLTGRRTPLPKRSRRPPAPRDSSPLRPRPAGRRRSAGRTPPCLPVRLRHRPRSRRAPRCPPVLRPPTAPVRRSSSRRRPQPAVARTRARPRRATHRHPRRRPRSACSRCASADRAGTRPCPARQAGRAAQVTSGRRERIAPGIDVVRPGNAGFAPTVVSRLLTDAGRPDARLPPS